jgi:hypothetical protein
MKLAILGQKKWFAVSSCARPSACVAFGISLYFAAITALPDLNTRRRCDVRTASSQSCVRKDKMEKDVISTGRGDWGEVRGTVQK